MIDIVEILICLHIGAKFIGVQILATWAAILLENKKKSLRTINLQVMFAFFQFWGILFHVSLWLVYSYIAYMTRN